MIGNAADPPVLRAVSQEEIGRVRLAAGDAGRRASELAALLCGPALARVMLERALERHERDLERDLRNPFAVPSALAVRALGQALEIDLPVVALQMRTHHWVQCGGPPRHVGQYFLTAADWKSLVRPLSPSAVMREANYLQSSKLRFEETTIYRRYLDLIEQGVRIPRNRKVIDCKERLDDYFSRYTQLFRSISTYGVLRMREVRERSMMLPGVTAPGRGSVTGGNADIGIAIGPGGAIAVLPGGQHRLAIATVLQSPKVPVQVRMIHVDWLRGLERGNRCAAIGQGIIGLIR